MKQASFRFRLNFKQQFFVFFVCSSILPLVIFSILFLGKSRHILTVRSVELLRLGILLSEELVEDELDKLNLLSDALPAAALRQNLASSDPRRVAEADALLQAALPDPKSDMLVLFDAQGHPMADTLPAQASRSSCLSTLTADLTSDSAPHLYPRRGIVRAEGCLITGSTLMLGSLSPIASPSSLRHPSGFLFLGRDMRSLTHNRHLTRLPSEISFRILRRRGTEMPGSPDSSRAIIPLASTNPDLAPLIPTFSEFGKKPAASFLFWESAPSGTYRSIVDRIRDIRGVVRGYVVVSLPKRYWSELINEDTVYLVFSMLAAIVLISLLGQRFNRAFVVPLQALSAATHAIADGNLDTRLDVHSDDEETRRTLRDFNRMVSHLREKEDLRQNFIATLTHDLRTPLIAQKRTLEFFRSYVAERLDPQGVRLLNGLNVSNDSLLEMINHMLETFNYESGRITLRLNAIPFRELVDDCLRTIRPMADERRIRLCNEAPEALEIQADPEQMKRVLLNLLGNSIQNIAPGDSVSVNAQRQSGGQVKHWCEITVSDTGPGMDQALMAHIFDRYPTVAGRQQKIGSGLGLFICRMIVELHGGAISVSSSPGQGTHFQIRLPDPAYLPHVVNTQENRMP